jgi:hypothetical protein
VEALPRLTTPMLKEVFLAALLVLSPTVSARAQSGGPAPPEALREFVMTKSGETVRVWTFFDCADPRGIPGAFGTAANGLIAARRATELQCGNPEQPVVQIFYTPREGFYGEDDAVVRGPGGQEVQIKVRVNQPSEVAEAPPPRLHAKSAADRPAKAIAAEAPSKTAARPQRISRPRVNTAGVRSCTRKRGEATILRVFRCEFAAKGTNRRRVRTASESAR